MKRPVVLLLPMVCLAGLAMPAVLLAAPSTTQGSPAEMQCTVPLYARLFRHLLALRLRELLPSHCRS